jgi:hypothetical protein
LRRDAVSLLSFAADTLPVFAHRGRLIQKLLEGDPVAWAILGGIVVIVVGYSIYKAKTKKGESEGEPPDTQGEPPPDAQ